MTPLNRIIAKANKQTGYGWAFARTTQALINELDDCACDGEVATWTPHWLINQPGSD